MPNLLGLTERLVDRLLLVLASKFLSWLYRSFAVVPPRARALCILVGGCALFVTLAYLATRLNVGPAFSGAMFMIT